jgi:prepilin-type N-terminal cleavage/methylation domain-containing protein
MNTHPMKNDVSRGFSLIEVLVAIALLSVVTTIGVRTFSLLTTTWKETQALAGLEDSAGIAFREIRKDLSDTLSAELSGVSIIGIDQFVNPKQGHNQAADEDDRLIIPVQGTKVEEMLERTRSIQYRVEREGGRASLVRTRGALGDKNPSLGKFDFIPLVDVVRFDVTYATGKSESPWVAEWSSNELPRAVRVSMTLADPNNKFRQISRKQIFAIHVR